MIAPSQSSVGLCVKVSTIAFPYYFDRAFNNYFLYIINHKVFHCRINLYLVGRNRNKLPRWGTFSYFSQLLWRERRRRSCLYKSTRYFSNYSEAFDLDFVTGNERFLAPGFRSLITAALWPSALSSPAIKPIIKIVR